MNTDYKNFIEMLLKSEAIFNITRGGSSDKRQSYIVEVENLGEGGYAGFTSFWTFTYEGNLVSIGHYE